MLLLLFYFFEREQLSWVGGEMGWIAWDQTQAFLPAGQAFWQLSHLSNPQEWVLQIKYIFFSQLNTNFTAL